MNTAIFAVRPCTRVAALPLVLAAAGTLVLPLESTAQHDWSTVDRVRYEVVGEFSGTHVTVLHGAAGEAAADVADRVELRFVYSNDRGLQGEVEFTDFPTQIAGLRHGVDGCPAPRLGGPYEHGTLSQVEEGYGAYSLHLTWARKYPAGEVAAACGQGWRKVSEFSDEELQLLSFPPSSFFFLGDIGESIRILPGSNTIIVTEGNWTWTFVLSPAP